MEQDTLTGGLGADIFVLGDANGVYYDDGDPLLTGESDFALITDFEAGIDTVQLHSSADLYLLDYFTDSSGVVSAAIIYDPGVSAREELIGILENVSIGLNLSDSSFSFV